MRLKLNRPNHKYPSCHPFGAHLTFPVTATRFIPRVEFVFPSSRSGRLNYPHTSPSWLIKFYSFPLTGATVLLHQLLSLAVSGFYWTAWPWRWRDNIPSKGWEPLTLTQHHITAYPSPLQHWCENLKSHKVYLVSWISESPQYLNMTHCHTHLP